MLILGITNTEDSGAVLFKDGRLVGAVSEERLNRQKVTCAFPEKSISWLLEQAGATIKDIDLVASGAWAGMDERLLPILARAIAAQICQGRAAERQQIIEERLRASYQRDKVLKEQLVSWFAERAVSSDRLRFYDHHLAHACAAYDSSPFGEAAVLTADLRGDYRATVLWDATPGNGLSVRHEVIDFNSFGAFYAIITKLLGFKPNRHEGKVMGLAAHSTPEKALPIMRQMIELREGEPLAQLGPLYKPFLSAELPALKSALSGFSRGDIASAAQAHLEGMISGYLSHHLPAGRKTDLALAGGIFANVRLNALLAEHPAVGRTYVFPHMGDGGCCFGAALLALRECGEPRFKGLSRVDLGPSFSDAAITALLTQRQRNFSRLADPVGAALHLLLQRKLVGWFQGRMEFGPRALGQRSILASPADPQVADQLNARLRREEFMPFAPMVRFEDAARCFSDFRPDASDHFFMTTTYRCTEYFAEKCPSAVHLDGTARPQLVKADADGDYYRILDGFSKATGIPALINTSFNTHEHPIVCHPDDALQCLDDGGVDAVIIGKFIVPSAALAPAMLKEMSSCGLLV